MRGNKETYIANEREKGKTYFENKIEGFMGVKWGGMGWVDGSFFENHKDNTHIYIEGSAVYTHTHTHKHTHTHPHTYTHTHHFRYIPTPPFLYSYLQKNIGPSLNVT